jgi:hypothetical protein
MKSAMSILSDYKQWDGINPTDRILCVSQIFPRLKFARPVVNCHPNLVFSEKLEEFSRELSIYGWDLANVKANAINDFGGTNDAKHLLPLNILHRDESQQIHTNAQNLSALLHPQTKIE